MHVRILQCLIYINKNTMGDSAMGQLVSDVRDILDYSDSKKEAESTRQKILAEMAADEQEKTNLVKKH